MERKYILFDTIDEDDNFGLITVFDTSKSLHYHAERDVPNGSPYIIVSQSQLPENFGLELGMYTIDFSNPHGFGSGSDHSNVGFGSIATMGSFQFETYDEWLQFYKDSPKTLI